MLESGGMEEFVSQAFRCLPTVQYLLLEDQDLIKVNGLETAADKELFCSFHIFMLSAT